MPDVYVRLREGGVEGGVPIPADGRVRLTPVLVPDPDAWVTSAPTVLSVVGGVAAPESVSPGRWRVDVVSESWARRWELDIADSDVPVNLVTLVPVDPATPVPWLPTEADLAFIRETRERIPELIEEAVAEGDYTGPPGPPGDPGRDGVDGADGRGVVSIADDDGDGTATVTYSDGTAESLPLPPGPPGTDGVSPPPPEIAWDGSHLVVGGERSPDLTGPEGPAPAVSWEGPRLNVGGVVGPDLTGPAGAASTVPGPPGAVPTAADYAIVGPGRPDVPASTGGLVSASTPVGATYTSTDGAGVGAFVWRKRPDGSWVVIDGDTGWVELTSLVGLTSIYQSGRIFAQRQPDRVRLRFFALATTGGGLLTTSGQWPEGFRISTIESHMNWSTAAAVTAPLSASGFNEQPTFITFGRPSHTVDPVLSIKGATNANRGHGELDAYTSDPWPHTLP